MTAVLFDLLRQGTIQPLVAQRFPIAEARRAHELRQGGVTGKIDLVRDGSSPGDQATAPRESRLLTTPR